MWVQVEGGGGKSLITANIKERLWGTMKTIRKGAMFIPTLAAFILTTDCVFSIKLITIITQRVRHNMFAVFL